jgi:hypothetical protein
MLTPRELDDAKYNARDTLGMCRVYSHLVEAVEAADVANVYEIDEFLADLALQMTRVGMPVNSERRQGIGERLRALRDSSIEVLRPYTEGEHREEFLLWVAKFFAAKVRKCEPVGGAVRIGPTRAQAALDELLDGQRQWREFKKLNKENPEALAEADTALAQFADAIKTAKAERKAAMFEEDQFDGLTHTDESAFDVRVKIRRADAELAIAKRGVNYTAKVQQCAILRTAGVPLIKRTPSGLPQIDKEVLEQFSRHPSAKALLKYILTDKTINVYIEGEKRAGKNGGKARPVMVTLDGYIHPLWTIHKITGRWGSSPNVQNWSKRAGGGEENLRVMIEAPEGYTFVGADQAQLESRLVGAMSQCQYLCDTFRRGEDIHGAFAAIGFPAVWPKLSEVFKAHKKSLPKGEKCHCPDCGERDRVRDLTKRLEYGCQYGGQAKAIWEALVGDFPTLTQRQVQFFLDEFSRKCWEVVAWRQKVLAEAIEQGEIRSPILGRRQVFPLGRVDPTVAFNYKAQSGGADLWALGAIEFCKLWDQFDSFDARIIHNGHDSVLILCRKELAKQVETDVYKCWNREWQGVPFFMEAKIADCWADT